MINAATWPIPQHLDSCRAAIERAPPYLNKHQVRQLWDAGSFLVQEYCLLFNTRITVVHSRLDIQDRTESVALISDLIHKLGLRLKYWTPVAKFHWLYVHENTSRRGFTTTMVMHIPDQLLGDAEHWLFNRFLAKRFNNQIGKAAVRFTSISQFHDRKVSTRRHLQLMQMVCRSADPAIRISYLGRRRALVDVLGIRNRTKEGFQSQSGQRFRICESLGEGAQRQACRDGMEMLSAFSDKAFHHLLAGWELREHQDRQRTRTERAQELARIDIEWPKGVSQRQDQVRQVELNSLYENWGSNPKWRQRQWTGWWLENAGPPGNKI